MDLIFDELFIYKLISFLLTLSVIILGIKKLVPGKGKMLFISMLIFFFLSTILFFPEGRINDWNKHIPFFIGQILFYFWLENIFKQPSTNQVQNQTNVHVVGFTATGGLVEWFNFLTDQGLQHIITLPFSVLIVTIIKVRFSYIQSAYLKNTLNIFTLAIISLTMIHIGEFVVESQAWLPFLESSIEVIEFIWYYLALSLFAIGIKRLAQTPT